MTDSYFAQARYYNAKNGRFVSEDKVRGYIDSPDTINHYLYCWNTPIDYVDYNGKFAELAINQVNNPLVSSWVVDLPTPGEIYVESGFLKYEQECEERRKYNSRTLEEMQCVEKKDLPDYTEEIDRWLFKQNKEIDAAFDKNYMRGSWVFFEKVRGGHEMDIKVPENWDMAFDVPYLGEDNYFLYHDMVMNASTLGNVTYAHAGAEHFSDEMLYTGGAAVQIKNRHDYIHLPMMHMLPFYGDMPEDHEAIALGIKWKKEGFCDE